MLLGGESGEGEAGGATHLNCVTIAENASRVNYPGNMLDNLCTARELALARLVILFDNAAMHHASAAPSKATPGQCARATAPPR